jgi:hypothetical protein
MRGPANEPSRVGWPATSIVMPASAFRSTRVFMDALRRLGEVAILVAAAPLSVHGNRRAVEGEILDFDVYGITAGRQPSSVDTSPMVGAYTDCRTAPRVPFRPARHDFRVRDEKSGRSPLRRSARLRSQPLKTGTVLAEGESSCTGASPPSEADYSSLTRAE